MGMQISKTAVSSGIPIWQGDFIETAQGGFTLDAGNRSKGDTLKAGTILGYDESTRKASEVVVLVLTADATDSATKYKVKKGHGAKVGTNVTAKQGGAAYAISAIDTSNDDYDEITVGTTLGVALSTGDTLFESSATGATAGAFKVSPKGLLKEDLTITANDDVAVVIRGTVYENRIPAVPDDAKSLLPGTIIFSQSY